MLLRNLESKLLWAGLALVLFTGLYNVGIIALDDYSNGFAIMVPAQSLPAIAPQDGVHPYLPKLFLRGLTRMALALGMQDPLWQLRFTFALLGVFSFLAQAFLVRTLFAEGTRARTFALFLIGFYFLMPLFLSRPMIESLAMPWLSLSAAFGVRAFRRPPGKADAEWAAALLFLSVACLFRFQAGVCGAALASAVLLRRSAKECTVFALTAAALFVLTGLPDVFLRGEFHGQLRSYVGYNLTNSGEHYGVMPFYTFILLLFGLTLPPALFSRYRGLDWKRAYQPLWAPLGYLVIFTLAHSISPHKEDRFIVPVLPLLLVCLVPLLDFLWEGHARWRLRWFLALNGVLLFAVTLSIPQNNVVSLAGWLTRHSQIQAVDALDGALAIRPQAFIARTIEWGSFASADYSPRDCSRLVVTRWDVPLPENWLSRFRPVARFHPTGLEALLVHTNPRNARRGPLEAFQPIACPD
ncbi:hypothetical protein K2X33_05495 [bacterium]|nr:hypothetical protein [bacterium]